MKIQINKYIYWLILFSLGVTVGYVLQFEKVNKIEQETVTADIAYSLALFYIPDKDIHLNKKLMLYAIIPSIEYLGGHTVDTHYLKRICAHWKKDHGLLNSFSDFNSSFISKHSVEPLFLKGYKVIDNYCAKSREK